MTVVLPQPVALCPVQAEAPLTAAALTGWPHPLQACAQMSGDTAAQTQGSWHLVTHPTGHGAEGLP